jgi:SAM-dependent methyltransferase
VSSSYREELNRWLATLEVKADYLIDIGGSQVSLKPRVKSWNVKEYLVADLYSPHEHSPNPDIALDLNELFINEKYEAKADLITCFEVMDYIWNPAQALENISYLLRSGGTAYITFPSVYPLHQPIEDDALRYMPGGIKKLAGYGGLEVVEMIPRRPETSLFEQFFNTERMRAAKHVDHNFTGWIVKFKKVVI